MPPASTFVAICFAGHPAMAVDFSPGRESQPPSAPGTLRRSPLRVHSDCYHLGLVAHELHEAPVGPSGQLSVQDRTDLTPTSLLGRFGRVGEVFEDEGPLAD